MGKTSIILKVVNAIRSAGYEVGGMVSREVKKKGMRIGFELEDLKTGRKGWLAHKEICQGPRIGKYFVNMEDLDNIGVRAIQNSSMNSSRDSLSGRCLNILVSCLVMIKRAVSKKSLLVGSSSILGPPPQFIRPAANRIILIVATCLAFHGLFLTILSLHLKVLSPTGRFLCFLIMTDQEALK